MGDRATAWRARALPLAARGEVPPRRRGRRSCRGATRARGLRGLGDGRRVPCRAPERRSIALDISLGAVRGARRARAPPRVRARSRSSGTPSASRFADALRRHRLRPRRLHHLDDPLAALAEMARVARSAVCVSEPARAGAPLSPSRSGSRSSARRPETASGGSTRRTVEAELRSRGLRDPREPTLRDVLPARAGTLRAAALAPRLFRPRRPRSAGERASLGRFGNKLAVVAVRP